MSRGSCHQLHVIAVDTDPLFLIFAARFKVTRREVKVTFELCIHLMEEIFRVKEKNWVRFFVVVVMRRLLQQSIDRGRSECLLLFHFSC